MIHTGTPIRMTTHNHAELAGENASEYVEGLIASEIRGRDDSPCRLWLIDLGREVAVNLEHRKRVGKHVRYLVLRENWERCPLEWVRKGYWIAVTPYAVNSRLSVDALLSRQIDLRKRDFVRLAAQMCYQRQSGHMDPYADRWIMCRILNVRAIGARLIGQMSIERPLEVRIMLSDGKEYTAITSDMSFVGGTTVGTVPVVLSLANCRTISKTSRDAEQLRDCVGTSDYEHEATGMVIGLWWPEEKTCSIQTNGQLIMVEGDSATSVDDINLGDSLHVVGTLRLYRGALSQDVEYSSE